MTSKVFISYRRDDSSGSTGRLHDRLEREFGRDLLFMDVDAAIPLGVNFVKILREEVAKCDVLLAVVGPNWLNARDDKGDRRLDNPNDFVRIEIAAALQRDIPVIPILLDGAKIPKIDQLPDELGELTLRNGLEVRHASFHGDVDRLARGLKNILDQLDAATMPQSSAEEHTIEQEIAALQRAESERKRQIEEAKRAEEETRAKTAEAQAMERAVAEERMREAEAQQRRIEEERRQNEVEVKRRRAESQLPRQPSTIAAGAQARSKAAPTGTQAIRTYRSTIWIAAALILVVAIAAAATWRWANIGGTGSAPPTLAVAPKPPGQVAQDNIAAQPPGPVPSDNNATPAAAQRVVLYEEDPKDPNGKNFVGSANWRTETVSPGAGLALDLAVRADIEIPDRRMTVTWSLRRNTDKALPASHTIEIMFNLPADFPGGGIANVPGVLMKQAEQARGTPLAGLAVKVTNGFFLIGLSAVDADRKRNMQLLKDQEWFDIPIVYTNGGRAIMAVEKGPPGDRAFADAFAAWAK
jgi:TIR domain-containing protein